MFLILDGVGAHYGQLTRAMRAAIVTGQLSAGTKMPSSRALAEELNYSRTTVLASYDQLRAEGYIDGRAGSGTYVSTLASEAIVQAPVGAWSVVAPSRFASRVREQSEWSMAPSRRKLRFDMQYASSLINPGLGASWARRLARAATEMPFGYGVDQGLLALREQICRYVAKSRNIQTTPDRVIIVSGTQQALALCSRVLVDEGDAIAMEEPHYCAARQQFAAHGARVLLMPTDSDGLVCRALPTAAPRLILVTPAHQFPSGAVMSLPRRLQLLNYAGARFCWIVEDDFDGGLHHESKPLPPMRSLDRNDRVIHFGTLSRMMFDSLGLSYMIVPEALRDDFVHAKNLVDFPCSAIDQLALAHFMDDGGFERHMRFVHKELRVRHRAMIDGLRCYAGERVKIAGAHSGMHLVGWMPDYDHDEVETLVASAAHRGLGLYSIARFYQVRPSTPGLVLGYAALSKAQIRDALQLFGECLNTIDARAQRLMEVGGDS
jgi:GntR family transcriptional regulator/MocR family aminotransferase